MSWVAELKAKSQKKASVYLKNSGNGTVKATPPRPAPTINSMVTIQKRLVFSMSTMGLQSGLITQGK
jgi:hypothetical protein